MLRKLEEKKVMRRVHLQKIRMEDSTGFGNYKGSDCNQNCVRTRRTGETVILNKRFIQRENMKTKIIINIIKKKAKKPNHSTCNTHFEYYLYRHRMLKENIHLTKII